MTFQQDIRKHFNYKYFMFILNIKDVFITIGLLIFVGIYSIFEYIINFIKKKALEIVLFLLYVIPPTICYIYYWDIPSLYILYAFIMTFRYILLLLYLVDDKQSPYDQNGNINHHHHNYSRNGGLFSNYSKLFDPIKSEKLKNGGLTDVEVKNRKKEIWKKLL
jgi:hypothetical protein